MKENKFQRVSFGVCAFLKKPFFKKKITLEMKIIPYGLLLTSSPTRKQILVERKLASKPEV